VDKGTNQPNVFYDPKSSESFLPYFSNGLRDDFMQRAYLDALISYWDPVAGHPAAGNNPSMIETDRTCSRGPGCGRLSDLGCIRTRHREGVCSANVNRYRY